jgi:hypothetical protein
MKTIIKTFKTEEEKDNFMNELFMDLFANSHDRKYDKDAEYVLKVDGDEEDGGEIVVRSF